MQETRETSIVRDQRFKNERDGSSNLEHAFPQANPMPISGEEWYLPCSLVLVTDSVSNCVHPTARRTCILGSDYTADS